MCYMQPPCLVARDVYIYIYIYILYREYGNADIKEIKLMARGRKRYETVGTLHFASVR